MDKSSRIDIASLLSSISNIPSMIAFSRHDAHNQKKRIPISCPIASMMIDLPEPVSPLRTVNPSENCISSLSMIANCFIDKVCNINSSHPYNKLKILVLSLHLLLHFYK